MTIDWGDIGNFLKDQAPLVIALLYAYMNGRTIRANQEVKNQELKAGIQGAHAKIDARFSDVSDINVVKQFADTPGSKPS